VAHSFKQLFLRSSSEGVRIRIRRTSCGPAAPRGAFYLVHKVGEARQDWDENGGPESVEDAVAADKYMDALSEYRSHLEANGWIICETCREMTCSVCSTDLDDCWYHLEHTRRSGKRRGEAKRGEARRGAARGGVGLSERGRGSFREGAWVFPRGVFHS